MESVTKPIDTNKLGALNSTFVWKREADVAAIWRKYGWTPPSEYRSDYFFKTQGTFNE